MIKAEIPITNQPISTQGGKVPSPPIKTIENVDDTSFDLDHFKGRIFHWWHKIVVVALVALGIYGLWEIFEFFFIEYPKLEIMLEQHIIEIEDVNRLIAKGIITSIMTILEIIFAIRLNKVAETTAQNLDLIIGTIIALASRYIRQVLVNINLLYFIIGLLM
jgi:hypothetical protein